MLDTSLETKYSNQTPLIIQRYDRGNCSIHYRFPNSASNIFWLMSPLFTFFAIRSSRANAAQSSPSSSLSSSPWTLFRRPSPSGREGSGACACNHFFLLLLFSFRLSRSSLFAVFSLHAEFLFFVSLRTAILSFSSSAQAADALTLFASLALSA